MPIKLVHAISGQKRNIYSAEEKFGIEFDYFQIQIGNWLRRDAIKCKHLIIIIDNKSSWKFYSFNSLNLKHIR